MAIRAAGVPVTHVAHDMPNHKDTVCYVCGRPLAAREGCLATHGRVWRAQHHTCPPHCAAEGSVGGTRPSNPEKP